ncbi:MAG: hypothetical protein JRF33_04950 [Deltaproteobacteria bacterium]|nr:hypothetical protein [Deltaproteobacteria bacterium]
MSCLAKLGLASLLLLASSACQETYIPCEQHYNCPDDMVCEDARCIPDDGRPRPCSLDMQCRTGERCRGGLCSDEPACSSDEECPEGFICHQLSGDCRPVQPLCSSNFDCPEGSRCDLALGQCVALECIIDIDCGPGQVCDPATATCSAGGPQCTSDADCIAGQRCDPVAGVCRAGGCMNDADCGLGQICDRVTGFCRNVSAGCTLDSDCPAGSWCDTGSGTCKTGCRNDADCPTGTVCETTSGACLPPSGCTDDEQCPDGYRCDQGSGQCEAIPGQVPDGSACVANADCDSANCVPITEPAVCLSPCRSSAGCAPNHTCVEITSAWYCLEEGLYSQLLGINVNVGSGEYGQACSGEAVFNPYCHSVICHTNLGICTSDCTTNNDCNRIAGSICRVNTETGIMRSYCFPDPGLYPMGSNCDSDYYCAFNVCLAGYYVCSGGCCASRDCPAGWSCGRIQSSDPYAPGFAKGCVPNDWTGSLPVGSACTGDTACRSGMCLNGSCTDLCCTDADCPSPMRCSMIEDDNNLALTICQ